MAGAVPILKVSKLATPEAKIIALLDFSDRHAVPRPRWIQVWKPPRGTKSLIKVGPYEVYVNHTGEYYSVSWGRDDSEWGVGCYVALDREGGRLNIHIVKQDFTSKKVVKKRLGFTAHEYDEQQWNEADTAQAELARKACELLEI